MQKQQNGLAIISPNKQRSASAIGADCIINLAWAISVRRIKNDE